MASSKMTRSNTVEDNHEECPLSVVSSKRSQLRKTIITSLDPPPIAQRKRKSEEPLDEDFCCPLDQDNLFVPSDLPDADELVESTTRSGQTSMSNIYLPVPSFARKLKFRPSSRCRANSLDEEDIYQATSSSSSSSSRSFSMRNGSTNSPVASLDLLSSRLDCHTNEPLLCDIFSNPIDETTTTKFSSDNVQQHPFSSLRTKSNNFQVSPTLFGRSSSSL